MINDSGTSLLKNVYCFEKQWKSNANVKDCSKCSNDSNELFLRIIVLNSHRIWVKMLSFCYNFYSWESLAYGGNMKHENDLSKAAPNTGAIKTTLSKKLKKKPKR